MSAWIDWLQFGWSKNWRTQRKERRRRAKFEQAQANFRGLSIQQAFEQIYSKREWGAAPDGSPFWSGNGSRVDQSLSYEDYVVNLLERHPAFTSIVDVGCGDFQVSRRILQRGRQLAGKTISYVGLDVVPSLIEHHTARYTDPNTRFAVCNAVEGELPRADLGLIRQILQHLSNDQAAAILEKASRAFKAVIVVESLPITMKAPNLDIGHGVTTRVALGSGIYIDQPPFYMPVIDHFDAGHTGNEILRTSLVWFDSQQPYIPRS